MTLTENRKIPRHIAFIGTSMTDAFDAHMRHYLQYVDTGLMAVSCKLILHACIVG